MSSLLASNLTLAPSLSARLARRRSERKALKVARLLVELDSLSGRSSSALRPPLRRAARASLGSAR